MKIEYEHLVLENFGPYEGRHTLSFSPLDGGIPVTLVDGKNGYGKTTLLQAFHYLLYGINDPQKRYRSINRTALENGKTDMKVELSFRRGSEQHQILRALDAPPGVRYDSLRENLTYLINGTPQANPITRIREVLPKPASQFFFFDGAKIARYADLENSQEVRDAIELVLGLPAYENASKHLKRLQERWEKKAREESAKDVATRQFAQAVDDVAQKMSMAEQDENASKQELDRLRNEQEEVKAELAKFAGYEEKLNRIERYESDLQNAKDKLQALRSEQAKVVRRYAQWHLLPMLEDRLNRLQDERATLDETLLTSERRSFVEDLMKNLKADGPPELMDSVDVLQAWIEKQYPQSPEEVDRQRLAVLTVEIGRLEQKVVTLKNVDEPADIRSVIKMQRTRVAKMETELKEERRGLTQSDEEKARSVASRHDDLLRAIGSEESKFQQFSKAASDLRKEYEALQIKMNKATTGGQAKVYSELAERSAAHRKTFDILLEKARNLKRKSIEKHATDMFKELTRKPEVYARFQINDDYTLALLDQAGREQRRDEISSGEKQLVALSFIVGLMKSTDRVAPLIIDTPFGHLDKTHRAHVAKHLPSVGQQLTLLITDADLMPEYEQDLLSVTGKTFKIQYNQRTQSSSLVEVN